MNKQYNLLKFINDINVHSCYIAATRQKPDNLINMALELSYVTHLKTMTALCHKEAQMRAYIAVLLTKKIFLNMCHIHKCKCYMYICSFH